MSMRKCIAFFLVLALLLLPGCKPRANTAFDPNPDGTLGPFRWGMTWTEAARADKRIADEFPEAWLGYPEAARKGPYFTITDGTFLGYKAVIELYFERLPEEGEDAPMRLVQMQARMLRSEEEPDYIPQVVSLTEACFPRELRAADDLCWTSAETFGDRVGMDRLAKEHPCWAENSLEWLGAKPLWSVTLQAPDGPADVYGSQASAVGHREFLYTAQGYYQVRAELLRGK